MQELTRADTVIFCPGAVQADPFVEEIDFTGRHTTSDQELLAMTQLAHSRGMRVFWKPTVNCLDGTWRARISFFDHDVPCETKWSGWFASYQAFQLHFAALVQQAGADMLILGCEMTQAERREAEWRRLIAAVRSVYAGAVSYNCDKYGEEHVSWWDALDVIASSGYYPIGQIDQNLDRIEPVVQHFQKPFFFAEAGCMQIAGSAAVPNNWGLQGAPDPEEQARWYNALLTACQARPWFDGTAFWDWPLPAHAAADRYAFIQGPALDRIRAFLGAVGPRDTVPDGKSRRALGPPGTHRRQRLPLPFHLPDGGGELACNVARCQNAPFHRNQTSLFPFCPDGTRKLPPWQGPAAKNPAQPHEQMGGTSGSTARQRYGSARY